MILLKLENGIGKSGSNHHSQIVGTKLPANQSISTRVKMTKIKHMESLTLAMRGDFSMQDQIYPPEYRSLDLRTGLRQILRMIKL